MAESSEFKEKRKIFSRVLKNYAAWKSLVESEGLFSITLRDGEEIHYMDILDGFKVLPPRQRQAVWLMCVEDLPEVEVAQMMGFKGWPTPVQQYKNIGLARLIKYQEATVWEKFEMQRKARRHNKVLVSA